MYVIHLMYYYIYVYMRGATVERHICSLLDAVHLSDGVCRRERINFGRVLIVCLVDYTAGATVH